MDHRVIPLAPMVRISVPIHLNSMLTYAVMRGDHARAAYILCTISLSAGHVDTHSLERLNSHPRGVTNPSCLYLRSWEFCDENRLIQVLEILAGRRSTAYHRKIVGVDLNAICVMWCLLFVLCICAVYLRIVVYFAWRSRQPRDRSDFDQVCRQRPDGAGS